jgi:hypothetical protein
VFSSGLSAGVKDMSLAAGVQAPVNGLPRRPTEVNEALEYEKIIGIYHQVIAGNHPRLRLSGPVNAQAQPTLDQHSSQVPFPALVTLVSESTPPAALKGPQLSNSVQALPAKPTNLSGPSLSSKPVPSKTPASELDPIFLTKSDDLVRAEIQLQRQRVERALREQVEQKRIDARHKPSFAEAKPEFDVADVLTKALTVVKPIVFDEARGVNENGSATDSFDENSFYSSKAPDSTPNDGDDSQKSSVSKHQVQPVNDDELDADRLVDRRSDEMQQVDLPDSPYRVIPRPDFSTAPNVHYRRDVGRERDGAVPPARTALDEDDDEPEYSPPEPVQLAYVKDGKDLNLGETYQERARHVNGKHANQYQNARRYGSPIDADMRVVRSHITSPIAPQPSRVSPLAVAKGPPFSQNRRHRQNYGQQRRLAEGEPERTSPDMAVSTMQPRKKRKVQEARRGTRRRAIGSPDPIIKEEPVSPPPFHDVPPLGAARNRPAAGRPIYIDVETPQDVRYVPEPQHEVPARQVIYDVEGQTPHSAPRVLSRAGLKDGPRTNQDLRRVVSLQNLPPREYADLHYQTPARLSRAPSYATVDGPGRNNEVRSFEGQPQIYERPQMVEEMPLLSPAYRDAEAGHRFVVPPMPPPPQRRIVIDEYGQRFYETIQPARASIAPTPARRIDADSYNDIAISRNAITRAASVLEEPYREARYIQQEMPPPQMIYRRVAEAPRPATSDLRYAAEAPRSISSDIRYITREPIDGRPTQRSGSVQMYDYPVRQSTYIDDSMAPREPLLRVSSVRPMARPPYEEPQEVLQRVQSVRPEAREFDVIPEERPQARREVMQAEAPRYEVRRTADGERYYRIDDAGRMMLDGAVEARPSYAPRY